MGYNKVSANDRQRVYDCYAAGDDWKRMCKQLGICVRTAYHWLHDDKPVAKPKGGSRPKKTDSILASLVEWIEEKPSVTLSELRYLLIEHYDVTVSISTIKNWLDGQLITLKTVRAVVANMNNFENKEKRVLYMQKFYNERSANRTIIWVDETNFNMNCKRAQGRSRIGCRASIVVPACKGANLHCIGAMSSTELVYFSTRRGALKSCDFNEWIEQLIVKCEEKHIRNPTFVIDNAPAHAKVENVLENHENVEVLRLAPYSYLLNPIELLWSSFKSNVKREMRQEMPGLLTVQRTANASMSEQRMQTLEAIAARCISCATGEKLMSYANRVETYYHAASRGDDLKEHA